MEEPSQSITPFERIMELLPILRCPRTHGGLHFAQGKLVSDAGEEYPIINGKPVLVRSLQPHHLMPPEAAHISQNQERYVVEERSCVSTGRCLHLGSGNVPCSDPRVVSFDVLPCENVDIVGEAEELPFVDDAFDFVDSGAVFEHLRDPLRAIKEVKRVTAPGGRYLIDTAFLQSYHGFPAHYFNLTPLAAESFLVDDFILEDSHVPGSATPVQALLDLSDRFLGALSKNARLEVERLPLRDLLDSLRNNAPFRDRLLQEFSEYSNRALAASFVIAARKPAGWKEAQLLWGRESALREEAQLARREYYELRMTAIQRHHEVFLYERLCRENGIQDSDPPTAPAPIRELLAQCQPADILSRESVLAANDALRRLEEGLRVSRDRWIDLYTGAIPLL
jgi:SAM-dependent methyltransferase